MKITLTIGDKKLIARRPHDQSTFVEVNAACPRCKIEPMQVQGNGNSIESRDTYRADARCLACGETVGTLRVKVSTIFGIEEDDRVLNGRCRVY
jgi:hypothetical protein